MNKTIKLKTFAISSATQKKSGLKIGCCDLSETEHPVCKMGIESQLTPLQDIVGLDTTFIYRIDDVVDNKGQILTDVGLGYITIKRNSPYLVRESAFMTLNGDSPAPKSAPTEFALENKVCVSVYNPISIKELSFLPHNIIWYGGGLVILEEERVVYWNGSNLSVGSLSNINNDALTLKPTKNRPSKAPKGTLVFNEILGKLQVYNGKDWKTIDWEEEQ